MSCQSIRSSLRSRRFLNTKIRRFDSIDTYVSFDKVRLDRVNMSLNSIIDDESQANHVLDYLLQQSVHVERLKYSESKTSDRSKTKTVSKSFSIAGRTTTPTTFSFLRSVGSEEKDETVQHSNRFVQSNWIGVSSYAQDRFGGRRDAKRWE